MSKAYYLTLALAICVSIGAGLWVYRQAGTIAVLKQDNKALVEAAERAVERDKAARKVLVARQADIATVARQLASTASALQKALQANKLWSDTDVPMGVQTQLRGLSSGSDVASGGVPNAPGPSNP